MFTQYPPGERIQPFQIIRPKPGKPITCVAACERWSGVVVHWYAERRYRCLGEHKCKPCQSGNEKRWQGFIPCMLTDDPHFYLLGFTDPCCDILATCLDRRLGCLGTKLVTARMGMADNSPQTMRIYSYNNDVKSVSVKALDHMLKRIFSRTLPVDEPVRKEVLSNDVR